MNPDRKVHEAALAEVQRLVCARVPDDARLVEALLAERREAAKIQHAKFMADERIPLEDRLRWGTPLSDEEKRVLQEGGLSLDKEFGPDQDPIVQTQRHIAQLLIESLTVDEAADLMGVSTQIVDKRAKNRELYSLEVEYGLCRFPLFQFDDNGLLPGFREVAPHICQGASLLGISNWFTLDNPDLFIDDDIDQTLSPRDWLRTGRDPKAVISLLRWL